MRAYLNGKGRLLPGAALAALTIGATAIAAAPTAPHIAPIQPVPPSASAQPAPPVPPARAIADLDRPIAPASKAMHGVPGEVRAALVSARATIEKAPGMRDEDRREALSSIDQAITGLERRRGPDLR